MSDLKLINGRTMIKLNEHGVITKVADAKSNLNYFNADSSKARLFHLVIPGPKQMSRSVAAHESTPPVLIDKSNEKILRYENLKIDDRRTGIDVDVSFKLFGDKDEILMSMKLVNRGNDTVTGVMFPWISGWESSGNKSLDTVFLGPGAARFNPAQLASGWRIAWANNFGEEYSSEYPTSSHVPWISFSKEQGTVSCINYQKEPLHCYATVKNMAGFNPENCVPSIFWGFYPYVTPGMQWQSPEIGISVHDGDWHETADCYQTWAEQWFVPASQRKIREAIGSSHVIFSGFDGTSFNSLEKIPEAAAAARKCGIDEFCVWDCPALGLYGTAFEKEEDLFHYSPEEKRKLREQIKRAVDEGSDVSTLVNFRLLNPLREVFKKENLVDETQETLLGTKKNETWPVALIPGKYYPASHVGPACNVFSPFSDKYRQRILKLIDEYLDFGYTSLFYDQPFEYLPDYSRKDKGGSPERTYATLLETIRQVRDKLKEKNPEALIMGEQCDIFASRIIDQWMCWVWSDYPGGIETMIRVHYSLPQTIINCVISADSGAPEARLGLVSHAFAAGLHLFVVVDALTGTLADVPELGEYIRKLAALRKHCAARTAYARFRDNRGLSLKTDDGLVAYSYDGLEGPAVIVAAPEKSGSAEIRLYRDEFTHPGSFEEGRICNLDLKEQTVSGDVQTFFLEKNEVIVWMA